MEGFTILASPERLQEAPPSGSCPQAVYHRPMSCVRPLPSDALKHDVPDALAFAQNGPCSGWCALCVRNTPQSRRHVARVGVLKAVSSFAVSVCVICKLDFHVETYSTRSASNRISFSMRLALTLVAEVDLLRMRIAPSCVFRLHASRP